MRMHLTVIALYTPRVGTSPDLDLPFSYTPGVEISLRCYKHSNSMPSSSYHFQPSIIKIPAAIRARSPLEGS